MTINLQSIFISSMIFKKNQAIVKSQKKVMFERHSMAEACRRLFKPCYEVHLKVK